MRHTTTSSHPAAPWSAVELVTTSKSPSGRHNTHISRLLARVIYQALFDEDLKSVTLLAVSGHDRERYLLRSRPTTRSDATTKTLANLANDELPLEVGITIVDVDPAPLGNTPVPVHRLLTTRDHPVKRARTATPTPFEQLLEIVAGIRPHAVQLIVGQFDDEWFEVSIRIADFSRQTAIHTAAADARYHQCAHDVAAPFDAFNLTTNRELIFDHGWEQHTETRLPGPPAPMVTREREAIFNSSSTVTSTRTLSRNPTEYAALCHDREPAAPLTATYAHHKVLPWVRLSSELLPEFCGLREQTYQISPWDKFGRAPPQITPQHTLRKPTPPSASPSPSPSPSSAPIPTAEELEIETSLGRTALNWVREQGGTVSGGDSNPFEEFTAAYPERTHRCVVLTDPEFIRGDLIAVAAGVHQSSTTDVLTVFTDETEVAAHAYDCLQQPFVRTDDEKTRLYTQSMRLPKTLDTAVHCRSATSEWVLTSAGNLEYYYNGSVIVRAARDADFSSITAEFPQVSHRDGRFTVTSPVDDGQRIYKTNEACFEEFAFVRPPAVPTWLATGLEFGTVLTTAGDDFREYQSHAEWDRPSHLIRDENAASEFFDTYTVADPDRSLTCAEVEPEFTAWLRHQTKWSINHDFSASIKNGFPGTSPSIRSDDLEERTWRYPFEHTQS